MLSIISQYVQSLLPEAAHPYLYAENTYALCMTFVVAVAFLKTCDVLAYGNYISSKDSRKLIHIGTGPLYVLCWGLFRHNAVPVPGLPVQWQDERCLAALVPLVITVQFGLIGLGIIKDEAAVKAMSRDGKASALLQGPLYYGIMFVIMTVVFWKSPEGILPLMLLCGGDGCAEVVGRRLGVRRLPWSSSKTYMGLIGFIGGGFALCALVWCIGGDYGTLSDAFPGSFATYSVPVLKITAICAIIESLCPSDFDNVVVVVMACLLTRVMM